MTAARAEGLEASRFWALCVHLLRAMGAGLLLLLHFGVGLWKVLTTMVMTVYNLSYLSRGEQQELLKEYLEERAARNQLQQTQEARIAAEEAALATAVVTRARVEDSTAVNMVAGTATAPPPYQGVADAARAVAEDVRVHQGGTTRSLGGKGAAKVGLTLRKTPPKNKE